MRPWMTLLAMIPACGFHSDGNNGGDGGGTPDAQQCFGSFVNVCLSAVPTAPVTVMAIDIDIDTDTGASPMCDPRPSEYCVIAGTSFAVATGRKIRGHGTRPLILVATTTTPFDLSGDIDVSSSHDGTLVGAGALAANVCMSLSSPPSAATMNSGGFGGSFGGKGGDGEQTDGAKGTAGAALTNFPTALRGGCPGGTGGGGGISGNGGGGVMIIATEIRLNGKINASGGGGHGGPTGKSGGGGGGSGGMIVIEAPMITGVGTVFANGGGGGQGGTAGGTPAMGADGGESAGPAMAGAGGTSATEGGDGGSGSVAPKIAGLNAGGGSGGQGGGGAGGGGAGFIRAHGVPATVSVFPTMIDLP